MHCKGYFEQTIGASLVLEVIPFDEILLMQRQVENSAKLVGSGGVSIYINIYRYYIHFHIYIYICTWHTACLFYSVARLGCW